MSNAPEPGYEPPKERSDPTVGVTIFLGFVLMGLMVHFGIRGLTETDHEMGAVRAARLYRLAGTSETLAEAVVSDAAVDPRAVVWTSGPARGPMRGVLATVRKGKKTYEYRFDVDLETGAVHPSNPRSERVFTTLGAPDSGSEPRSPPQR